MPRHFSEIIARKMSVTAFKRCRCLVPEISGENGGAEIILGNPDLGRERRRRVDVADDRTGPGQTALYPEVGQERSQQGWC